MVCLIFLQSLKMVKIIQNQYMEGRIIFGELEIFDELPYVSSIKTLSASRLLELGRESFLKWINFDINISNYILKTNCELFYRLSKKASFDILYFLKQRVYDYLILNSKYNGNTIIINKNILSGQMAVSVRSINRVLQGFKEMGIIDLKVNTIMIKDFNKLHYKAKKEKLDNERSYRIYSPTAHTS